jgi:serine/threonine protein kinase
MEHLHAANVLHCDLKPGNVLLKATTADRRGFICKLADFGMSRLLDPSLATHVSSQSYGVRIA